MVDDGSRDGSWEEVERLSAENSNIRGIKLQRNYGKSAALYCGFETVQGEVVFTMESERQDSPLEVP